MIKLTRLNYIEIDNFKTIFDLYETAFPATERRDLDSLFEHIKSKENMFFDVIYYANEIAGFIIYWQLSDFYFLEHFAIFETMRNKKIGEKVLDLLQKNLKNELLFEVEHPNCEFSQRRINFYERNGFSIIDKDYCQPSYCEKDIEYPLYIMSNNEHQIKSDLNRKIKEIKTTVYNI